MVYLQLKFDETQNDYLIQALVHLVGVELNEKLEVKKLLIEKIKLTHLFLENITHILQTAECSKAQAKSKWKIIDNKYKRR